MEAGNFDDSFFSCSSSALSDADYISAFEDDEPHLRDILSKSFDGCAKNLNVVHINAQSIPKHHADILATFDCNVVDAILVSETFLKPSLPTKHFVLPGYRLIRNDRIGKGCGGVGIYLRADLPFKLVDESPHEYSNSAEYLFLELSFRHHKVLLGVYYPPSLHVDYFSSFENALVKYSPIYDHIIILGDFNTCLIKNDSRSDRLRSITSSVCMNILPLSATHHPPNHSPSLLDLILTSNLDRVATHGQLPASFSYHDLIYISYRIRCPRRKPQFISRRSFNKINTEALTADVSLIDWSRLLQANDINEKIDIFNATVLNLYDHHAPLKRFKVKHRPAPWLSNYIKTVMAKRDLAKKRYNRLPTDENLAAYKALRNRCSKLCRNAKRKHIYHSLDGANPSQMWRFLKTLGIGKTSEDSQFDFNLDSLNTHFSSSPIVLSSSTKSSTLHKLSIRPKPNIPAFTFLEVDAEEIKKVFHSISSQAIGSDGICLKMIMLLIDYLAPIVVHLVNFSLKTNKFPTAWKSAFIIPLPKTSNPTSLSHFRPISILPILSKVLEKIAHSQLSSFLYNNNLLSAFQSGFRPCHSTVTALVKVSEDIRSAIDNKQLTALVLLDFSNAFNSVDFDILLGILSSLNISTASISWVESYLRGRSQSVRVGDSFSNGCELSAGVPQGGVLSPLLFSIFINSLTHFLSSHFHLYADDLQIYRHFKLDDLVSNISLLNDDLISISVWAKSFGLLVNPSKSQSLIIGNSHYISKLNNNPVPALLYDGVAIQYSDCAKNLGVLFDANLSWDKHVDKVSQTVFYTFHSLKRLQEVLPTNTRISLAQSLLLPLLDYADVCYLDATEVLLNKLERLQNLCIRFIFGLRKYDHVSDFRSRLKWLPIRRRRDLHVLSFLFSVLYNPAYPSYLRDRFSFLTPEGESCRSTRSRLLKCPTHSTARFGDSFTVHATRLWNQLPPEIRESGSLNIFKNRVKEHYLSLP